MTKKSEAELKKYRSAQHLMKEHTTNDGIHLMITDLIAANKLYEKVKGTLSTQEDRYFSVLFGIDPELPDEDSFRHKEYVCAWCSTTHKEETKVCTQCGRDEIYWIYEDTYTWVNVSDELYRKLEKKGEKVFWSDLYRVYLWGVKKTDEYNQVYNYLPNIEVLQEIAVEMGY